MTFLNWHLLFLLWGFCDILSQCHFLLKNSVTFWDLLLFSLPGLSMCEDEKEKKDEKKTLLAPNLPDKQLASIGSISHWSQWALAATQINLVLNWCTTAFKLLVPDHVFQLSPAVSCHPRPMERRLVLRQHSVLQPFLPAMLASCWWGQLSESACHLGFGVEQKHDV